jgi:hypothetical protein
MRSLRYVLPLVFVAVILFTAVACTSKGKGNDKSKGFVVIELFTSEGCSSCPPADALVAKIQQESEGKPIYILAYHVDYWNRLGWKDVFSSADYSNRQKQYVLWMHSADGVYTPQIVVNGKTEFVGSEEKTLRNAIKTSLANAASSQVSLSNIQTDGQKIKLQYQTGGDIQNTILQLAVIQKSAQTKVGGGENNGRTLSHVQIVRALQSIKLKHADGAADISVPKEVSIHGAELIALLQDSNTGAIRGATKIEL